jgi:hypothetical protein
VDDVWLFLHWGLEWIRYPEPAQRDLAREFTRAGADLVVGTHPHVVRGRESIFGSPVYYSLGNFVFPPIALIDGAILHWEKVCRQGMALKGMFDGDSWIWLEAPLLITTEGCSHRTDSDEGRGMQRSFANLSAALTDKYIRDYPSLRRKEMLRHFAWRLWTMSWRDRGRLLGRRVRSALHLA